MIVLVSTRVVFRGISKRVPSEPHCTGIVSAARQGKQGQTIALQLEVTSQSVPTIPHILYRLSAFAIA